MELQTTTLTAVHATATLEPAKVKSISTPDQFDLRRSFRTLYAEDNIEGAQTVQVVIMPTSTVQLTSTLPIPSRYPYQHLAAATDSHMLARMFLQLVGQMTGMISGDSLLVLFDVEPQKHSKDQRRHRDDAIRTFERLAPECRPEFHFVARPEEVAAHMPSGSSIFTPNPMDFLRHLKHTVDPDVHYGLLSKRELVFSGLPTPRSEVVDTRLSPAEAHDSTAVAIEAGCMLQALRDRALPFVVKLPQALAGTGTFLVRTETERHSALTALSPEVERMIHTITLENVHLKPANIIYQDLINGPAVGLSLFITKSGRAEFISCTQQIYDDSDGGEGWSGGYISYPDQERLCQQYADISILVAQYMYSHGYHGPVGVDVLTDDSGVQMIIDMNVRITGTMPLGFWKPYFLQRGFQNAVIFFPLLLGLTRDDFEGIFERDIADGRVVQVGWSSGDDGEASATIIMVAGKDEAELDELVQRINRYKVSP